MANRARLNLETLETREVPSVTLATPYDAAHIRAEIGAEVSTLLTHDPQIESTNTAALIPLQTQLTATGAAVDAAAQTLGAGTAVTSLYAQRTQLWTTFATLQGATDVSPSIFSGFVTRLGTAAQNLQSEIGQLLQINAGQQGAIIVAGNGPGGAASRWLDISVRTGLARTYAEIRTLNGNPDMPAPIVTPINHTPTADTSTFRFNVPSASPSFHEDIQVRLFADAALTQPLGQTVHVAFAHYDSAIQRLSGASSLAPIDMASALADVTNQSTIAASATALRTDIAAANGTLQVNAMASYEAQWGPSGDQLADLADKMPVLQSFLPAGSTLLTDAQNHLAQVQATWLDFLHTSLTTDADFTSRRDTVAAAVTAFAADVDAALLTLRGKAGAIMLSGNGPGGAASRWLDFQARTALPQTYLRIRTLNGNPDMSTPTIVPVTHAATDTTTAVRFTVPSASPSLHEDVEVTLFADAACTQPVGQTVHLTFGHYDQAPAQVSGAHSLTLSPLTTTEQASVRTHLADHAVEENTSAPDSNSEAAEDLPVPLFTTLNRNNSPSYTSTFVTYSGFEAGTVMKAWGDKGERIGDLELDETGSFYIGIQNGSASRVMLVHFYNADGVEIGLLGLHPFTQEDNGRVFALNALPDPALTTKPDAAATYDKVLTFSSFPNLTEEFRVQSAQLAGVWPTENAESMVQRYRTDLAIGSANYWDAVSGMGQSREHVLTMIQDATTAAFYDELARRTGQAVPSGDRVQQALYTNNPDRATVLGLLNLNASVVRAAVRANFDAIYQEACRLTDVGNQTLDAIHQQDILNEQRHEFTEGDAINHSPWAHLTAAELALTPAEVQAALDRYVVAVRDGIRYTVMNHVAAQQAQDHLDESTAAMLTSDNNNLMLSQTTLLDGIGGNEQPQEAIDAKNALLGSTKRQVYADVLGWYDVSQAPLLHDLPINRASLAGQILFAGFNRLWMEESLYGQWFTALQLQLVTDIPAQRFLEIREATTIQNFVSKALGLTSNAQYGNLLSSAANTQTAFAVAKPNLDTAHPYASGDVRIRFDLITNGVDVRRIVATQSNGQILATTAASTFIRIPVGKFQQQSQSMTVTLTAYLSDGTTVSIQSDAFAVAALPSHTPPGSMPLLPTGDFSTLPNTDPNHGIEADVMKNMIFPLEGPDWTYGMGSGWHYGSGLFALDLNLPGETDHGAPVHAPITGTIGLGGINLREGMVRMTEIVDGKPVTITFFHMNHILQSITGEDYESIADAMNRLQLETVFATELAPWKPQGGWADTDQLFNAIKNHVPQAFTTLQPTLARIDEVQQHVIDSLIASGLTISQWDLLGLGGNEGHAKGSHVHMDMQIDKRPVNLFGWADAYLQGDKKMIKQIPIGGAVLDMHYDSSAKALVNDTSRIALMRVDAGPKLGMNEAYAWEAGIDISQMKRVVFDRDTGLWYEVDMSGHFITNAGLKHVWKQNLSTNTFDFIWQ
jgi:hypothetical protein